MEHLKKLYVWKVNPEYDCHDPRPGRFKLSRGLADPAHYRSLIDLMVNDDVIWRSYEDTWEIMSFHDICWYSGWIMASKSTMCLHLSERVLRQYDYVHGIPRSPTVFVALKPEEIVVAFQDFLLHIILHDLVL